MIFGKRCLLFFIGLFFFSLSISSVTAENKPSKESYPHWNFTNVAEYKKLEKIDNFIEANKNQGYGAVFDWDGTIVDEFLFVKEEPSIINSSQMNWYIWTAYNANKYKFAIFPKYSSDSNKFPKNFIDEIKYIIKEGYSQYNRTLYFITGMLPEQIVETTNGYFQEYPPSKIVNYRMLDVMQKMVDSGFNVWIITGSNPYYISAMIDWIEKNLKYSDNTNYKFNISTIPFDITKGKIVGNTVKISNEETFLETYNDIFIKNKENKPYYTVGKGKTVALENYVSKRIENDIIFSAGNSSGDYYMMEYVLNKNNSLGIFVNPKGSLVKLLEKYPKEKIVVLEEKIN